MGKNIYEPSSKILPECEQRPDFWFEIRDDNAEKNGRNYQPGKVPKFDVTLS